MTPVLATRFTIYQQSGMDATQVFAVVVEECKSWLQGKGGEFRLEVDPQQQQFHLAGAGTGRNIPRISWHELISDDFQAWQGSLTHPLDRAVDPQRQFLVRVEIVVRRELYEVVFTLQLILESLHDRVSPPAVVMTAPKVIGNLLKRFSEVYARRTRVSGEVTFLRTDEELEEIITRIEDVERDRGLPLVVISRKDDGNLACLPHDIARKAAGLARVYVLPQEVPGVTRSSWHLTNVFGQSLSVFGGAVRIYWPGFHKSDSRYRHPLWTERTIANLYQHETMFSDEVLRHIAAASAIGISPDAEVGSLEREQALRRLRDSQVRIEAAERRARIEEGSRESLRENVDALNEENKELTDLLALGDAETKELKNQIHQLQARAQSEQGRPVAELTELAIVSRFHAAKSFLDLVRLARDVAPPSAIEFLPRCDDSAAKSPHAGQLNECWSALTTLIQGAIAFHNDSNARLMDSMKSAGATADQFKADVSDSAHGLFASDYLISYQDAAGKYRSAKMGPHLKYGRGNRD